MLLQQYPIPGREGKKSVTFIRVWGMHISSFHVHKTTDPVELEKTLEWTGSGAEVSEAVAHCHRGQMKTARITFALNTREKN